MLEIYTQTWSGNERMMKLANKCGFEEVNRRINLRKVKGKLYDNITYKLNKEIFWNRYKHLAIRILNKY